MVLMAVLAEVVANFVVHLTVVRMEEPTVIVRSALTLSNRAKKSKTLKTIVQCELEDSRHTLCADEKVGEKVKTSLKPRAEVVSFLYLLINAWPDPEKAFYMGPPGLA